MLKVEFLWGGVEIVEVDVDVDVEVPTDSSSGRRASRCGTLSARNGGPASRSGRLKIPVSPPEADGVDVERDSRRSLETFV